MLYIAIIFSFLCFGQALSNEFKDEHWDVLIYTQRWPNTVCKDWIDKNPKHQCNMPDDNNLWTVHGIWPTQFGKIGPLFCNKTWHFDPEEVRVIEPKLLQNWTSIEIEGSTYSFWAHEWNKHGTCAAIIDDLNTQLKYFNKGLDWLSKYSMTNILSSAGITPSNTKEYSLQDINNAIKSKLLVDPVIECRQEKGKNYLFEIRICFDKYLKFHNCDGVITRQNGILTNCHTNSGVLYASSVNYIEPPKTYFVQLYKLTTWLQWITL